MKLLSCPVCGNMEISGFIRMESFSYFNMPIKKNEKKRLLNQFDITELSSELCAHNCNLCGHIFLSALPDEYMLDLLYKKFYNIPSPVLNESNPYRENTFISQFKKFINLGIISETTKSILEIGCHDGYTLRELKKDGFIVKGCEPSKACNIAKKNGINVINKKFNVNLFESKKFDSIIFRYLLEHIINPQNFLEQLKKLLNTGGSIIIEVPDMEHNLKNNIIEGFVLQHYHYFNMNSLKVLLKKSGFEVKKIIKINGALIAAAVKSDATLKKISGFKAEKIIRLSENFSNRMLKKKSNFNNKISLYSKKNEKIAVWGAGGYGYILFKYYEILKDRIEYIIDSSPQKINCEYLDFDLKIVLPEHVKKNPVDTIIIASMYHKEISKMIKKNKFAKNIIII